MLDRRPPPRPSGRARAVALTQQVTTEQPVETTRTGMDRSRRRLATATLVLTAVAAVGCGSGPEPGSAKVINAVGLRLQRDDLTGAELTRATDWAKGYAASLAAAHPELAGLTVNGVFPVFDEATPLPIGAMARLVLPAAVGTVQLELIRSRGEVPERVPSVVTNLRSLDAVYEFQDSEVIFLGVSPLSTDAAQPETATQVRPVSPETHRDPAFGGED